MQCRSQNYLVNFFFGQLKISETWWFFSANPDVSSFLNFVEWLLVFPTLVILPTLHYSGNGLELICVNISRSDRGRIKLNLCPAACREHRGFCGGRAAADASRPLHTPGRRKFVMDNFTIGRIAQHKFGKRPYSKKYHSKAYTLLTRHGIKSDKRTLLNT